MLAGVEELRLLDPENLAAANVGRHILGMQYVGRNKADGLAAQLAREFPHNRFKGYSARWQDELEAFEGCDIIVSTIGSLDDELELNAWHLDHPGPTIIYGWVEPRACAAQAIAIRQGTGCLACGFLPTGDPEFEATVWPELPIRREPACGAWFMPYGADEAMSAAILIADLTLDVLTGRASDATHFASSARSDFLEASGGVWSDDWKRAFVKDQPGGRTLQRHWRARISCSACRGDGAP